jgi:toxin CptA
MLRISLNPSLRLTLLLSLAHAAAAGVCLVIDAAIWLKISAALLVGTSCGLSLYGPALLRTRKAIVALEITDGDALSFQTRRGDWHRGTLLDSSFVAPYLAVLNLKSDGSPFTRHVVIMPDSVAADDFRRLRVWLRWRKTGASDKKSDPTMPTTR